MAQNRKYYAEDIARSMERLTEVREGGIGTRVNATKIVADEFSMEPASFNALINNAKQHGFSKYPSMASV